MTTTVTSIAPVLLPILVAFAPTGTASYVRDPIDRGGQPSANSVYGERARHGATTVSLISDTTTLTQTTSTQPHVEPPRLAVWHGAAVAKILSFEELEDGWKGEGSLAPASSTLDEAKELIAQFATEMPTVVAPSISVDEDGSVCIYWLDGRMMATVSVHGDGTYAFYAEGYDDPARSDSAPIGTPLPSALIASMTGIAVPTLVLV